MFGIFKKKSKADQLQKKYEKLLSESYALSKSNRALGDQKYAEAQAVLEEIEKLKSSGEA
jgi:uncharacterized protein Yka (UPF0111/DUF47 family)